MTPALCHDCQSSLTKLHVVLRRVQELMAKEYAKKGKSWRYEVLESWEWNTIFAIRELESGLKFYALRMACE